MTLLQLNVELLNTLGW